MTAVDWGSAPDWVGALLTGGSLLLGLYILLRERRKEEVAETHKLIFTHHWNDSDGTRFVHITNTSEWPFTRVSPLATQLWTCDAPQPRPEFWESTVVLPGESRVYRHDGTTSAPMAARFTDVYGHNWVLIFVTHQLVRAPRDIVQARHFEDRLAKRVHRTDSRLSFSPRYRDRLRYPLPRLRPPRWPP